MSRVLAGLVVCSVLWGSGCSGEEPGVLKLLPGKSLDPAPECSPEDFACPEGTSCLALTLDGVNHRRCFERGICYELVTCTGGAECTVLEQFPGYVTCSGR